MNLNIDDLLAGDNAINKIAEQVDEVKRSHGKTFPYNYAFTWIIANQVIQHYYARQGLDAIPVWRENFGWSHFNLTRASNCKKPYDGAADSQRYILFDAIAVNWKQADETAVMHWDVANAILTQKRSPYSVVKEAIDYLHLEDDEPFDHSACLHRPLAYSYTKLFQVVTDLICRAPELVSKRELAIDLNAYGRFRSEARHPLRKLGLANAGTTREWFELFHVAANTRVYINVTSGDLVFIGPDEISRIVDYPGRNELNEEQLTAYLAKMLNIGD